MSSFSPHKHALTIQLEPFGATDHQAPSLENSMKTFIILCLALFSSAAVTSANASTSGVPAPAYTADEAVNKVCPIGVEPIDGKTFAT